MRVLVRASMMGIMCRGLFPLGLSLDSPVLMLLIGCSCGVTPFGLVVGWRLLIGCS